MATIARQERRKRMVARRPSFVCATLAGALISAKNVTEESLEKLRESRGLRRPKFRGTGLIMGYHSLEDLRIGDTAFDSDYGYLRWAGQEWAQSHKWTQTKPASI
jgi:hypothetical protein